jgi:microcystin degradation protein MlrC
MTALEREPGVLSVSLAHGFPWGDTPEVGTRVLVVTDGDAALAARHAAALGEACGRRATPSCRRSFGIDARSTACWPQAPDGRPFVLADTADNPGIGAAGDSTFVLRGCSSAAWAASRCRRCGTRAPPRWPSTPAWARAWPCASAASWARARARAGPGGRGGR